MSTLGTRYMLARTECSALLGRMPSAVGYQPTLAAEMGAPQERITTTYGRVQAQLAAATAQQRTWRHCASCGGERPRKPAPDHPWRRAFKASGRLASAGLADAAGEMVHQRRNGEHEVRRALR